MSTSIRNMHIVAIAGPVPYQISKQPFNLVVIYHLLLYVLISPVQHEHTVKTDEETTPASSPGAKP